MGRLKIEYRRILEWLGSLNENRIILGLERIDKLMKHLGNPEKELEIVMIGGTNAKGSACFSLNSTLSGGGFKTGCFINLYNSLQKKKYFKELNLELRLCL